MLNLLPEYKRRALMDRQEALLKEYQSVNDQWCGELSDANREKLEKQLANLDQKIAAIDAQLDGTLNPKQWLEKLPSLIPNINFTEVEEVLVKITERMKAEQGIAALLMLQDAPAMGGDFCIERMKRFLKTEERPFIHRKIGQPPGSRFDPDTFVRGLGRELGCDMPHAGQVAQIQLTEYAKLLRQTLVNGLQSGCVTLLEIQTCDHVSLPGDFLPWYIREFWIPLVQQLPDVIQTKRRFIILCTISVSNQLKIDDVAPEIRCCDGVFDPVKLLSLQLKCWRQDEILNWLLDYARLDTSIGLEMEKIEAIAEYVFFASHQGLPTIVPNLLLKAVEEHYLQRSLGGIV